MPASGKTVRRPAAIVVAVLAVAGLALTGCSSGGGSAGHSGSKGGSSGGPATATNTVTIKNFAFEPKSITVKAGTVVTWTNTDSAPHTVTAADKSFDSKDFGKGKSYSYTFSKPGSYDYICSIHQYMKGTVKVT
jgi:plastocyanin